MNVSVSLNETDVVIERIEDEEDRRAYQAAMAEYRANPVTYTHEEVGKMLGLAE